jgi:hypothetical protein
VIGIAKQRELSVCDTRTRRALGAQAAYEVLQRRTLSVVFLPSTDEGTGQKETVMGVRHSNDSTNSLHQSCRGCVPPSRFATPTAADDEDPDNCIGYR